jgi:endo-1,4-beta-xylanase
MKFGRLLCTCVGAFTIFGSACSSSGISAEGSGGTPDSGGSVGSGGAGSGGRTGVGGTATTGGVVGSGGLTGKGGVGSGGVGTGGGGSGGVVGSGGQQGTGGVGVTGGTVGRDAGRDLPAGSGGVGRGGGPGTGGTAGAAGTGGNTGAAGSNGTVDCSATMPSGGTAHCGQNTQGSAGGLSWSLWSNSLSSTACITTFSTPAFSASWNNNGDFLARIGLEFGSGSKTYDQYGVIKADFSYTKTGSAGGYSYIGIYGWTTNPCVEWYIVDDRWGSMPFNAYNATQKGTATIDGESYKLFQNKTKGTGGSRCSGVSEWDQYWSIRQKARQCGTITISEHFKAWEAASLQLGGLLEAKILVEAGGGTGTIEFPVANVTKSQ